MKNFFKLLNFETNRFWNVFGFLATFTAVFQLCNLFIMIHSFNENIRLASLEGANVAIEYDGFVLSQFTNSIWFIVPNIISFTILGLYIFVIWYREWFGKSTFIYRLLMLPTSRITVYAAKLCTILIFTFGFLAWQIGLLFIEHTAAKALISNSLYSNESNFSVYLNEPLSIFIPTTMTEFILLYGLGAIIVIVLFTAILFERSYRWKGIAFAILYGLLVTVVLFAPILVDVIFENLFYLSELTLLTILTGIIVIIASMLLSRYLLKYKVNV